VECAGVVDHEVGHAHFRPDRAGHDVHARGVADVAGEVQLAGGPPFCERPRQADDSRPLLEQARGDGGADAA